MAKELAAKIKEAFVDDDFDVAVDLYSKAIDLDPNCAEFFADRARPTSNSNTSSERRPRQQEGSEGDFESD
ncbi:unnamed protein product [Brassica oleracea]|uniref:(rape) hypothetical protein n=1 Tax=Brassica napus TaxID=3708 RepID=A0A816M664_BRANA|nr:unnamed protein product [Brassica napus]